MRLILFCYVLSCCRIAYGQELVFSTPVPLGSAINSKDEELAPLLSPDGKTLYFIRAFHDGNTGGRFAGTDIWVSTKNVLNEWTPATRMNNSWNNKRSNAVIGFSADNSVAYLLNAYSNKTGISFSKLYNGEWGQPELVPIPGINRDDFVGFYVHPEFDIILISMKGKDTLGEEDLYISLKDDSGSWTEPRNLGPTINTTGFEISPFLSADKKRLYFSSNGHGGYGDADIFYCDRLFDSWETWSVPRNLGEVVNSEKFDAFYSSYGDSLGIFCTNAYGLPDIHVTRIKTIKLIQKDGKQLLTAEEITSVFGSKISPEIKFERGVNVLTSPQNELLYFIANKLLYRPDVIVQVQVSGNDAEAEVRATAIKDKLKNLGITESRIDLRILETVDSSVVRIVFFK
ncbi:MAG: PD40 domain-containing protein [Cyclobacteriaceae bacterium]|nr:PD40 domain-containing protein [Cyclobacteriaceae bacterium]